MGQARSRQTAHVSPDFPTSEHQSIRKAGSLTSLTLTKLGAGRRVMKPSRSFRDSKDNVGQQLKEKFETEVREVDRWVKESKRRDRPSPPRLDDLAAIAIGKYLAGSSYNVEGLPLNRELKEAVEFRLRPTFNATLADPKVAFSNSNESILYTGKAYSTTIMTTPFGRGFTRGRHAWIIYIETSRVQGWAQIGVVNEQRKNARCVTSWDGNPHPFRSGEIARRNNGNFHSGRSELEASMAQDTIFMGGYTVGDTITVLLDFDNHTLQWLKNGATYGSSVILEDSVLYPSVSLDSPGEGVSLVYYAGPISL